jgi:flagellar motor component MotA
MRSAVGILGFLGITGTAIKFGSPLSIFIDLPSLILVIGTIIFLGVSKYSVKELLAFSDEVVLSLINFSLLGGGIGFIIGMVQMLQNMSDPNAIGPAMAVAMLTVFYSLIIAAGLYAFRQGVKHRTIGGVAVAGSIAMMLPMLILILSFAKP